MEIDTIATRTLLAAILAAAVVVCVRRRVPVWAFAAALVAGVVAVVLATPAVWQWGFHGQMHWAFSLATLRSSPPEDPTFAGQPLMYPWTAHWAYAHIGRALHVSPIAVLAASDVLWLGVMVLAVGRAAIVLTGDRGAAVVAAFLAWTGVLVTDDGYIEALSHLSAAIKPCMRMVPADKFFNPNNNPIGLALGAVGILCAVQVVVRGRRVWAWTGVLLGAAFGCAVLYPISYVGLVAAIGGGGIAAAIARRKVVHAGLLRCAIAVAVAGAAALPWMLAFDSGRGPDGRIVVTALGAVPGKLAVLCAVAGPAAALLIVAHRARWAARDGAPETGAARAMLLGAAVALGGLYLALAVPLACEYKFMAQKAAPMALLFAAPIAGLARAKWWLAGLVLTVLSLGAADRELVRFTLDWHPPVRVERGRARAIDPERDAMLAFVRERAARNAVILTEDPLVPTVADRSVFLLPRVLGTAAGDGWSMGPYKVALAVVGHSRAMLARREGMQRDVLESGDAEKLRAAAAELRREFPDRPVYAIVTLDAAQRAPGESGAWREVYRWAQGVIYELGAPDERGATGSRQTRRSGS